MPNPHKCHLHLLLFPGFSNLCLANAVEPLRAVNGIAQDRLYEWRFLSAEGGVITSSSDLPVQTEPVSHDVSGDRLLVMPSYGHRALATPKMARLLRAAASRYTHMVGLDTGSWLLASAGLLDGYRATAHWDVLADLSECFPEVDVVPDRVVFDRERISCGGASTTLELILSMIDRDHSAQLSLEVAELFMHGERRSDEHVSLFEPAERLVQRAAALMRRHIEVPLTVPELAESLNVSERHLQASFHAHTGAGPSAHYRKIRLLEARRWVTTTNVSVAEVALRAGYADAAAMTRAFRAQFGLAPRDLRRR